MQNAINRSEMTCPANGKICLNGIRSDFENQKKECRLWTHVLGKDPQTEKLLDHFDCAISWLPVAMLEVSQMTRFSVTSSDKLANITSEVGANVLKMAAGLNNVGQGLQILNNNVTKNLSGPAVIDVPSGKE